VLLRTVKSIGLRGQVGFWHVCSLVGGQIQPGGNMVTPLLGSLIWYCFFRTHPAAQPALLQIW